MLDLVIKDAQIMAKVTEKEGVFGMIYTLTGLEKFDATICKMKQKDGQIEHVMFDDKNKKEFDAQTNKFLDLISQVK
jgi:23S rRNA maturation-related 3'-5' exoribonuclease YhaM